VIQEQWITPGHRQPATFAQAIGAVTRSRLAPGKPILAGDVQAPISVSRGDVVFVEYLAGAFTLKVRARALASARENDVIDFRVEGASQNFKARVVAGGRAVMLAPTEGSSQ
jgi:flagella basal body P-ring formation protein FlgA